MAATTTEPTGSTTAAQAKPPRSKKKVIVVLLLVLLLGAGGYAFLRPDSSAAPKPGDVETLEPILLNLAGGRYLKVGLALQLVEGVKEIDGAKALDAMITTFSGLPVTKVNDLKERKKLQDELTDEIRDLYEKEVMDTYYVLFVTQ